MTRSTSAALAPVMALACVALFAGCDDGGGGDESPVDATTYFDDSLPDAAPDEGTPAPFALHYHRGDGAYDGWLLEIGGETIAAAAADDFGAVYPLTAGPIAFRFTRDGESAPADPITVDATGAAGVWYFAGDDRAFTEPPPAIPGEGQVAVYYLRDDAEYEGWGLHHWGDVVTETQWQFPPRPGGVHPELGAWWLVDVVPDAERVNVIVHQGDLKDPGPDMGWNISELGDMVFLLTGSTDISPFPVDVPGFAIRGAGAHLLDPFTLVWDAGDDAASWALLADPDGGITAEDGVLSGGTRYDLNRLDAPLPAPLAEQHPHLRSWPRFALPDDLDTGALLAGQLVAVAYDAAGAPVAATRVQTAGAIDALFAYDGPLGVTYDEQTPTLHLWAPTARGVTLYRFDAALDPIGEGITMTRGERGVWTHTGAPDWYGTYIQYEVTAWHPSLDEVITTRVTDPYSVSLSADSRHTHLIALDDPAYMPEGWLDLDKPALAHPTDVSIYELHVRDFSIWDETVPAAHRGRFLAFTEPVSAGITHLRALADAGLTVLHLLPAFDIATVRERREDRVEITDPFERLCELGTGAPEALCAEHGATPIVDVLAALDPTGPDAQAIHAWIRPNDGFNWGYDPFHYTVPEGSYATDPMGGARILEFRRMVQSLAALGLRVALDVVYNHTHAAGVADQSVLDKIVPGYYHRLNPESGAVESSTCCANTASEHVMMERLMVDSVVTWARAYKVDAFRFDLMGHHMKRNMLAVQSALRALTPAADGVDGEAIYLYGEGWNFGEVMSNARGENATQANMGGTGIGTFNDRLRDAVRGGGPFDSGEDLVINQGFANGLVTDPSPHADRDPAADLTALLTTMDHLRLGMAANLKDYTFINGRGARTTGALLPYNGDRAGYAEQPADVINYVSKHDNQTLFDINAYKLPPGTSMDDRVRMQIVALATVAWGQGIPFFHAGSDLLRSKSMERDSYDSGDWFNRLDFSYATNNWNVGLPREDKDAANWDVIRRIIADESIAPAREHIERTAAMFRELLQIRYSTPLFRLRTAAEVELRVEFYNTGAEQVPGLIVMSVSDGICAGADLDPAHDGVMVLINAAPEARSFEIEGAAGYALHPVQAASVDPVVAGATFAAGAFTVPGRTAAVFVLPQADAQGEGPVCNTRGMMR